MFTIYVLEVYITLLSLIAIVDRIDLIPHSYFIIVLIYSIVDRSLSSLLAIIIIGINL